MTPQNPFDRRDFLKNSAAMSAAFAGLTAEGNRLKAADDKAPETSGNVKKTSPNDVLRVAVIGVRGRGMDHVGGFLRQSDCRITTICDVDLSVTGKAKAAITAKYGAAPAVEQDFRKVLENKHDDFYSYVDHPNTH